MNNNDNDNDIDNQKDIMIKNLQNELRNVKEQNSCLYSQIGKLVGERDSFEMDLNIKKTEAHIYYNFSYHLYQIVRNLTFEDNDLSFEDLYHKEFKNYVKNINYDPTKAHEIYLFNRLENFIIKKFQLETMNQYLE